MKRADPPPGGRLKGIWQHAETVRGQRKVDGILPIREGKDRNIKLRQIRKFRAGIAPFRIR
jgi:hypothetical protein